MLHIKDSPLAPYFQDTPSNSPTLDKIFYLDKHEAISIWKNIIDIKAKGLYDLSNESWVVKSTWNSIGRWIEAYNEEERADCISEAILNISNWSQQENLLFIQSSQNIISLNLNCFSSHWQSLFAAFDDGPLLLNQNSSLTTAFRFTPLGDIITTKINLKASEVNF